MTLPRSLRRLPWRDLKYALWLPPYLLIFLLLERLPAGRYWATQLPIDARIPFCEWFVIPYCLWYPFLVLTGLYLLARDRGAFRRYMLFLGTSFLLSEAVWLLIPSIQELRPVSLPRENPLTALVAALYRVDTNTNVFPSVHVLGALGAALAAGDCQALRGRRTVRTAAAVLAAAICLSTVFIKQHSVLDAAAGLLLGGLLARAVYRRSPALRFSRRTAQPRAFADIRRGAPRFFMRKPREQGNPPLTSPPRRAIIFPKDRGAGSG